MVTEREGVYPWESTHNSGVRKTVLKRMASHGTQKRGETRSRAVLLMLLSGPWCCQEALELFGTITAWPSHLGGNLFQIHTLPITTPGFTLTRTLNSLSSRVGLTLLTPTPPRPHGRLLFVIMRSGFLLIDFGPVPSSLLCSHLTVLLSSKKPRT